MTDIEIARNAKLKEIEEIAKEIKISEENLETYGKYKAKISLKQLQQLESRANGKLILVTSINPTPMEKEKRQYQLA